MNMWARWARRNRMLGLIYLTLAAPFIALAVLLYIIGTGPVSGAFLVTASAFIIHAVFEFNTARRYSRLADG